MIERGQGPGWAFTDTALQILIVLVVVVAVIGTALWIDKRRKRRKLQRGLW